MKIKCCKNKNFGKEKKEVVEFLKIISEESRLEILCILKKQEMCVCEIWQYLDSPQNLTSHHLKVLKDFKLISSRKSGLRVFYKLNKKILQKNLKLLNKFI